MSLSHNEELADYRRVVAGMYGRLRQSDLSDHSERCRQFRGDETSSFSIIPNLPYRRGRGSISPGSPISPTIRPGAFCCQ